MKRLWVAALGVIFLATTAAWADHHQSHHTKAGKGTAPAAGQPMANSLYSRLGGAPAIALVVDDFVERILVNKTLLANPAIKSAIDRTNKPALKFHATAQVCMVTGGPCKYTGRTMKESHKDMNISEGDWNAMVDDFKASLDKFKVPQKEQDELVAIVATTKNDIVKQPQGQAKTEKPKAAGQSGY